MNCQQTVPIGHPDHHTINHTQMENPNIYSTNTVLPPSGVNRENQNVQLEKLADISLPQKRTNFKSNEDASHINSLMMLGKGHIGVNKHTIKSEYTVKAEKTLSKSPNESAPNQLSQQSQHQKVASYTDHNMQTHQSKVSCVNTNPSIQNVSTPPSQSPCMPSQLSIQQSQIGGYMNEVTQHTRSAFESTNDILPNHMSIDDQYIRDQQMRYSQQMSEMNTIARPTVSYPSELVSNRSSYELSSTRSYDSSSIPTSTAFERYDPSTLPQRANMYPYMQPTLEDINNQQKYIHEQQQVAQAMMKAEQEENATPIYPRPMYHYDPSGTLPTGFSAINLSVKVGSIQSGFKGTQSSPGVPVIDLSTSSVTSSSPHGFHGHNFPIQRVAGSPPSSPHLGSPQVPSPQGQTLDLSVSRIPHW